jgi:hypothetical protein
MLLLILQALKLVGTGYLANLVVYISGNYGNVVVNEDVSGNLVDEI